MRQVLLIILLQLFAVEAYPQINVKFTNRSVLDFGDFMLGDDRIFLSAENENLCTDIKASESCQSKYFYDLLPRMQVLSLNVIDTNEISIKINPNMPDAIDVVQALKASNTNRFADIRRIRPVQIVGYRVLYNTEVIAERSTHKNINRLTRINIKCSNPKQKAKHIKNGDADLSIEVLYVVKHKRTIEFQVTAADIIKSEYLRDLFSPVERNEISAFHLELATRAVTSELISKFRINGPIDPIAHENYQDMKNIIYEHVRNYIASVFKQGIRDGMLDMQERAINLSDDRYKTDYTTRVVYDAQNMESEEFINSVHEEERKRRKSGEVKSGSGAMGILKLFKVAAEGKSGKRLNEEWHKLYTNEDKGKKLIQDSVNYEEVGKKYYPKSINVYEIILNEWNFNGDYKIISISYDQSVVPCEIQL